MSFSTQKSATLPTSCTNIICDIINKYISLLLLSVHDRTVPALRCPTYCSHQLIPLPPPLPPNTDRSSVAPPPVTPPPRPAAYSLITSASPLTCLLFTCSRRRRCYILFINPHLTFMPDLNSIRLFLTYCIIHINR